jgi:DNA-binding LacI/PurR family transcriptional regulator
MDETGQTFDEPKTKQVMERIRSSIVTGRFSPGFRLPTFVEMEGDFAVGRAVLQHAVAALKRDGFIRSEGRRGLYVTENPPHLYQYGLVMPATPGDPGWCQLMTALSNGAHRIEKNDPQRRFRFYYGIEPGGGSDKTLQQLRDDVANHRLAGLVIYKDTETLVDEVVPPKAVPRVYLFADKLSGLSPCLTVDGSELLRRSLRHLKERGRRRVALVQMGGTNTHVKFDLLFAEVGLDYYPPWMQWVGRSDPASATQLISLLMDYRRDQRPDALLVTDDNLVQYVSAGLVATGVKVGDEMEMIAHCNWPWPPSSVLPMVRIGFDVRQILQRAMNMISDQQAGRAPDLYQKVPAQFEWEIDTSGV